MTSEKSGFLEELKRRHVGRVAIAYAVAGWLLVQVATQVFPFFNIPSWAVRLVVVLIVIGFPVAVVLAWVFELTPEGLRRTEPIDSPDARTELARRNIGRKLNALTLAVLVLAVALLGWRVLVLRHAPAPEQAAAAAPASAPVAVSAPPASAPGAQAIPAKSIAVLPFQNLSDDKKNEYFVAGIQDLILTKLADIGGLKVIARTSTAKYASQPDDLKTVGEQLGVATILEGSVQKQGDEVLINVQLIDTKTDGHIWAKAYTRTLTNVFGVEGDVAEKIATALKAKLSPAETARLASGMSGSPVANNLFLKAEYRANEAQTIYDTASLKAAIPLYRQAIAEAPNFALAYARLSFAQSELAWFGGGGMDVRPLIADARKNAEEAMKLAPGLPAAKLAIGYSNYYGRGNYDAALKAFAAALALRPNDADTLAAQGYVQRRKGDFDAAIASLQKAAALDPRNSSLATEVGSTWMMVYRYPEAERWLQRALALDPHNLSAKAYLSEAVLYAGGDIQRALAAADGDAPALRQQRVYLLTYQRKYKEALALLDSIPDTPDNFGPAGAAGPKAAWEADLYRLMGDTARAKPLYAQTLPRIRARIAQFRGANQAFEWNELAAVEVGLGNKAQALDAISRSLSIIDGLHDSVYGPESRLADAILYAEAERPDLAVPLLAKVFARAGVGAYYAPVMLWLDPFWDPIRDDPGFQALLKKYAKYRPAMIPPIPDEYSRVAHG